MRSKIFAVLSRSHALWAGALFFLVAYALVKPEPVSLVSYYDCPGDSGPHYSRPGVPPTSFSISSDWCPTPGQERAFRKEAFEDPAREQQLVGAIVFLILGWALPVFLRTRARLRRRLGILQTGLVTAGLFLTLLTALAIAGSRRTGPDWGVALARPSGWSIAKEIAESSALFGATTSGLLALKVLLERAAAPNEPANPASVT